METVFTISGPAEMDGGPMDCFGLGCPPLQGDSTMDGFGAATPRDAACAQTVKGYVAAAGASLLGGLGTGVMSIYKFGQKRTGTGFALVAATAGLVFLANRLMLTGVRGFETCRRAP